MQLIPHLELFIGCRDYDCDWSERTADRAPADGPVALPLEGPGVLPPRAPLFPTTDRNLPGPQPKIATAM